MKIWVSNRRRRWKLQNQRKQILECMHMSIPSMKPCSHILLTITKLIGPNIIHINSTRILWSFTWIHWNILYFIKMLKILLWENQLWISWICIKSMIISGCGFGGLCFALADKYPEKYTFGMEIRGKVVNYVGEKIRALRNEGKC